jgi:hypothetical protein
MGTSGNPAKKASTAKKDAAKRPAKKSTAKKAAPRKGSTAQDFKDRARAEGATVSDIGAFKQRAQGVVLPLPSGLVVKARRVELQTFILQGTVPNPLMEIITEALEKGDKANIPAMVGVEEGKVDLDMVNDMFAMVEEVVVESVVEPQIHREPEKESDRDDSLLYVDEVEAMDKMFIFQWAVGGTSDLESFLEEAGADLDALAKMQGTA